jgi:hypothetical protein
MVEQGSTNGSNSPLEEVQERLAALRAPLEQANTQHSEIMTGLKQEAGRLHEERDKINGELDRVHERMVLEQDQHASRLAEVAHTLAPQQPFVRLLQHIEEGLEAHFETQQSLAGLRILLDFPDDETLQEAVSTLATGEKPNEGKPAFDIAHDRVHVIAKVPSILKGLWLDVEMHFKMAEWKQHELFGQPESVTYRSLSPAPPGAPPRV